MKYNYNLSNKILKSVLPGNQDRNIKRTWTRISWSNVKKSMNINKAKKTRTARRFKY